MQPDQSFAASFRDVGSSLTKMVRSEVQLAKAELKDTSSKIAKDTSQIAIAGGILVFGSFPLLAFLVIGLGRLLDDNYWLSSLIVGIVFAGVGAVLLMRALKQIKNENMTLPRTRQVVEEETRHAGQNIRAISSGVSNSVKKNFRRTA